MISGIKQLKHRPRGRPWPPGISGNPAGRPKGALNKLSLAVIGKPLTVNKQAEPEALPTEPVKFDHRRGHEHTMHKIDGRWHRTISQDGRLFDRETGIEIRDYPSF
jgi:hypothetical protein